MKRQDTYRWASPALLVVALLGLGGCIEYRIETTLDTDGSGLRRETVEVDENEDQDRRLADEQFVDLMNLSESDGWTYSLKMRDADSVHVFRRDRRIADLASWSDLSRSVEIDGTTAAGADSRVGYVRLGSVRFWNEVSVGTERTAEGAVYTYRETFRWAEALDALIEYLMTRVDRTVTAQYPNLPPKQVGSIVGVARGQLWAAIDRGLLEEEGEDELLRDAVDRTAVLAAKIAGQGQSEADEAFFRNMLNQLYNDEDDRLGDFLAEELPGFDLAPGFVFRLQMPGRVVSSNADEEDGEVLVWKFNAGDAMEMPVEIVAESVVPR
ncbi:MAG: hypothetical protein GWN99_10250 [Gemmatimonadetes bacterium]|uniref:Lipoprotein n=1 Tax=Candidatus Kutchimonas denitrificans TaxID=3056748 RepID=A0AAE4Z9K7_9BACT|nr:hypothetical protein [Gemmatimonadota bacterium]NIR74676.1 hypothetical protein [Candidatus Kutchimonas denitrificans]NIS01426.1 hypothetical protein [Gemmatimonadota bacterium]NIT67167.1 hypothetical protein [Gemmatimonadota bacterium]NIU52341.1 hypothetical protein [Gemmatimonadota bacterium]